MSTLHALAPSPLGYIPIPADAPVLPEYRVAGGADRAKLSVYSDEDWDIEPGNEDTNRGPAVNFINFSFYPARWREVVRALGWCAMNFDHRALPDRLEPIRPSKLKELIRDVLRYLLFLEARGKQLWQVEQHDLDAWTVRWSGKSYSTRLRMLTLVRRLYYYRRRIPMSSPSAPPWEGLANYEIIGKRPVLDENATERVPRSIMDPMLAWALFYVEVAAHDLFELLQVDARAAFQGKPEKGFAPLPGTSVPWREAFQTERELEVEAHYLVIAAYVIVAYLSGMRDGEVQSIEFGSRLIERDACGTPIRYRVKAKSSAKGKGKNQSARKLRTWVVLPEVHEALKRLEDLASVLSHRLPDSPRLKNTRLLFRRFRDIKRNDASFHSNVPRWLGKFQTHINYLSESAVRKATTPTEGNVIAYLYRIPLDADGAPWKWITKHFRRTIAWFIANEPFGIVAGMRQFGQVWEVTFQGYAGSPEAGFRDEIERAREVGKARDILDMYETVRDGGKLGGAKGAQLEKEFQSVAERIGDFPGKVVDEARLLAMLKNVAKVVYPGLLTDCFFDAATALCLKRRPNRRRDQPLFAQCEFQKCANSCFWEKHRPMFELTISEAKAHRKRSGLSKNQRSGLDLVIGKFEGALDRITVDG